MDDQSIAPAVLCLIHGEIRFGQQLFHGRQRSDQGEARTRAETRARLATQDRCNIDGCDLLEQSLTVAADRLDVVPRHQAAKLVAAEARNLVARRKSPRQKLPDRPQQVVTCRMSEVVIDHLEPIEVDHQQTDDLTRSHGLRDLTKPRLEGVSVE
jgi:hypothetical protein